MKLNSIGRAEVPQFSSFFPGVATSPNLSLKRRPSPAVLAPGTGGCLSAALRSANIVFAAAACLLAGGGCGLLRETATLPTKTVAAVVPIATKPAEPDPATVQATLMRYADEFMSRTTTGVDDYAKRVDTRDARLEALTWKVVLNSSALGIATGANPTANLVDFLALASLTRAFLEESATNSVSPGAYEVWLEHSRALETDAWKTAETVLTTAQQEEVRKAIQEWLQTNSNSSTSFFRRPQIISTTVWQSIKSKSQPGSVFALVGLDPTAGLDPAVREITRTRLFAERASYAMQRMPFLLRWQTELLTERLFATDGLTNLLTSVERLSVAAESASQTAAALPQRLSTEREALVEDFAAQEGKLRKLSTELRQTLDSGEKMSASLNTTLSTFDSLMKRFGVGEPGLPAPTANTNDRPFDILEYARTAERITVMAQELGILINSASGAVETPALDRRIDDLRRLSTQARVDAKSVLNHGFLLAAALVVLAFACALVYRRIGANRENAMDRAGQTISPQRETEFEQKGG